MDKANVRTTPRAQWTILTYIAAHNDLAEMGRRSLDQILTAGSSPEVKLAALYDGPDEAALYIAGEAGQAPLKEPLCGYDSGDGDALLKTARWAYKTCPAEKYGLVLWSHGTGWRAEEGPGAERDGGPPATERYGSTWRAEELERIAAEVRGDQDVGQVEARKTERSPSGSAPPLILFRSSLKEILKKDKNERAICFDDGTGHSLDAIELGRVMAKLAKGIKQPLDLLGMDACLMATLEVAYQVRRSVAYLVASEELVPGRSWPYDALLGQLRAHPAWMGHELAVSAVEQYYKYYTAHPPSKGGGDVTKVALDLSKVDQIATAVHGLAEVLLADMNTQADVLWTVQKGAADQETHGRFNTKFRYHLWDLGSLAARLATAKGSSAAVKAAAGTISGVLQPGGAVLDEKHSGDWFKGIGGLAIYAPLPGHQGLSSAYGRVTLAADTSWDAMLTEYHARLE